MTFYVVCSMLGFVIASTTVHLLTKGLKKRTKHDEEHTNAVLFFPDKEFPCSSIVNAITRIPSPKANCRNPSCRKLHGRPDEAPSSMIEFLRYLASAKESIDLCIYLFTQTILADTLYDLHLANVKIRVITDSSEDDTSASKLQRLRQAGIRIKSNKRGTGSLMHHKFVVIDDKLLLTGSFNWTSKAVVSNYEAVLVTSEQDLVRPFAKQFEDMWEAFGEHSRKQRPSVRIRILD